MHHLDDKVHLRIVWQGASPLFTPLCLPIEAKTTHCVRDVAMATHGGVEVTLLCRRA
jgi:hypothetical protein